MGSGRFLVRRGVIGAVQLGILLVLIFVMTLVLPGDAADVRSGDFTSAAQRARTRAVLGLDTAPATRFLHWAAGAAHGDFGRSLSQGEAVSAVIGQPLALTAIMAGLTTLLLVPVAMGAGFWAGLRPGTPVDRAVTAVAMLFDSIPDFVLAILLVSYLSLRLHWFPATFVDLTTPQVLTRPDYLVVPLLVMVARVAAPLTRLVRAGVIDQMTRPHIEQARRLGVGRWSLLLRHVAPNALAPAMQDLGRTGDSLLSGVLIVEAVFAIPGVATTLVDAVRDRDEPVLMALMLVTGVAAIVVNALIDIAGQRMVPRSARA